MVVIRIACKKSKQSSLIWAYAVYLDFFGRFVSFKNDVPCCPYTHRFYSFCCLFVVVVLLLVCFFVFFSGGGGGGSGVVDPISVSVYLLP